MTLYYLIWVDAIRLYKSKILSHTDFGLYSMVAIGLPMVIVLMLIMAILQHDILVFYFYELNIHVTGSERIDLLFETFILFFLPVIAFNYYFIFYRKKYLFLLQKYEGRGHKFFLYYMLFSYGLIVLFGIGMSIYLTFIR